MKIAELYGMAKSLAVMAMLVADIVAIGLLFMPGNISNPAYFFGLFILLVLSLEVWIITETKWKSKARRTRRKVKA